VLRGQYAGEVKSLGARAEVPSAGAPAEPLVVFAGRLIPEKRVTLGVAGVAAAAPRIPGLRAVFYGEGPERARLKQAIAEHDLSGRVCAPGFAAAERLDADLRCALCMLLPSRREGYGKVVVEASAVGTPSILVAGEDNAATELIANGVNGLIVERPEANAIADAIVRVHDAGWAMRESTARWYQANAYELSLEASLQKVLASYQAAVNAGMVLS
jgi:glycosyltransferase involved in cell wall biosynthesis